MITEQPFIKVGILEGYTDVSGSLTGMFKLNGSPIDNLGFCASLRDGEVVVKDDNHQVVAQAGAVTFAPSQNATFALRGVLIGVKFHWERKEDQVFQGTLRLVARDDGTITAINEIPVEDYLRSVVSSEMSAESPLELLKAHAITSRSWLVAMLERPKSIAPTALHRFDRGEEELIRWYTREDHEIYDVCADDHCQRYQGITKILSPAASIAIDATRGIFLVFEDAICDARFYKACGGLTEKFSNSWEDIEIPYLRCVADAPHAYQPVMNEDDAEQWILSEPPAYCNTRDPQILRQILPSFDRETVDFFRWKVRYEREELEGVLRAKSGFDFGTLMDLLPVQRGPSGRIAKLRIVGTRKALTVGKDLEIRRWLSPSHLYSSAFIVRTERAANGVPRRFVLHGAGWGHGVGLCQIGAAVMAVKGFNAEAIVHHYFPGARLKKLY